MMPSDAVQIITIEQDSRFNRDNTVTLYYRVRFMVGKLGPFSENFDKDGYTAAARDAKLQTVARELWVDPPRTM